jgi:hypothetical protein
MSKNLWLYIAALTVIGNVVKKVCGAGWNIVVGENPSTGREESSKQKSKQRKMCQDTGLLRLLYPLSYRTLKAQTQLGLTYSSAWAGESSAWVRRES